MSEVSATVPRLKTVTRLTFAGALAALLVGGLWFYESVRQRQHAAAEANLEAVAKLKVDEIVRWRAERLGDGLMIMEHLLPAEGLARLVTEKERGAARPSLLAQFRALQRAYGYEDILFADSAGVVRLSLSGAVGALHDEAVRTIGEAIRTHRPVLTDIHAGLADRPAHVDVVAPIWIDGRDAALGAVVLRSDAQTFLYPLIQTWPVPSASAETLLVRREGETVLFLNPLRYRKDAALTLRLPLSRGEVPAAMAARGQEGFVRGTDYRGVPVFAYVMRVPDSPWFVIAKVDASEILFPWRLRSILIAGLVLGLGAWIVTLSLALSQRGRAVHYASLVAARQQAEEKAEILTRSIDVHPDGAYWLDTENRFVYVNDAACKALGYEHGQLLRMTVLDVNPKATPERMRRVWKMLREEGHFFSESTHRRSDGSELPVEIATIYVRSRGQEYACGFARDVTERKGAEEALRRERDLFDSLLTTMPDSIYFKDRESRFVRVNDALARRFGLGDPNAVVGKTDFDFFGDEHARQAFADEQRVMATGEPIVGIEEKENWRDGRLTWASTTKMPMRDATGQIVGLVGVSRDVTAHEQAEETLRVSEKRFRTVFEAVGDGTVLADAETGRLLMANQAMCRMLGYTEEELLRLAVDDIHPPADLPMVKEAFQRQLSGEQPLATGIPVQRKDGSIFVADIHSLPLTLGDTRCLLGVFRDMTAFNEMEQQLRQAQKMEAVGQLAGGVAHDFNNILCVIQGHCELVLRSLREDDPLFKSIAQIQASGERAAALTRQLLAFSRKQPLQPEVLDLNATVSNLEGMLRRLIGEDVDFVTKLAADLGRVKADPGQVEQVIVNLAVNARDAMPRGGKLLIETANVGPNEEYGNVHAGVAPGRYVMLAITDTGSGMDQRTMERVFEPFFTTKEKGKGTGLGLATVYGIVKQSGGSIRVVSELGRGATFKVYLPRCDEAVAMKAAGAGPASGRGAGERVLLVEDEPALGEVVRDVLNALGYRVTLAANAGEALLAVEERRLAPDLLITDVVMPGMSGVVLAERLRRTHPGLKVLFMSGYTDDGIVRRGVVDPGTPFIQKPFSIDDFAAKVALVLHGHKPGQ